MSAYLSIELSRSGRHERVRPYVCTSRPAVQTDCKLPCYACGTNVWVCAVCVFFSHSSTLQLLFCGQAVVTGIAPFPPRFLPSIFIAHSVQQSHCARRFFMECCKLTLSHFPHVISCTRKSNLCAIRKDPCDFIRVTRGGIRTHEIDLLYQARGQPDTPPGRPATSRLDLCRAVR